MAIADSTAAVSRPLASPGVSPWATVRNGKPHSSRKTVIGNCVTVWLQKPSHVPGSPATARSGARIPAPVRATPWPSGESRTTMTTSSAASTPSAAIPTNAVVQPDRCSTATSGIAAASWPSWPTSPVTWVMRGTWRAGNHTATRLSTEMKVAASPAPMSTRATYTSGSACTTPRSACPVAMSTAPPAMRVRAPNRSRSTPTGTWRPAYTASWTTTNVDSTAAPIPNRSTASTPATPSEVRWSTATT